MDQTTDVLLHSDWYSPRRLHDSPTQYDFPGDRFIPNRSLMDLDQAHSWLTNSTKQVQYPSFSEAYRQRLTESLDLDSEGRPFRMLVFRGNPKSSRRKSNHLINEMRSADIEALNNRIKQYQPRCLPKEAARILDASRIVNDYYANTVDWGKSNNLAVALGSELYLWNAKSHNVQKLFQIEDDNDYLTSVAWSKDARSLAIGSMNDMQLWDAETSKCVRSLEGHTSRVAALAWNGYTLTSGSHDKTIMNHDVRVGNRATSCIQAHSEEVCGLKWSSGGNILASGGNESVVYIWEASRMSASSFLHRFSDHSAAVKALAWCPFQYNVLASGGGTNDGSIKMWNIQKGTCIGSINTQAQVCGLEWNRHHKELLSGHGYGVDDHQNQLCLWKYPSMTKLGQLRGHASRVLNLCQSPDGLTVASAGADETLRIWEIFGPPSKDDSRISDLDSLLSLKTSPIR